MKRREFITLVGGAAAGWPLAARAQKPMPVIAILGSGAADARSSNAQMLLPDAGLRELGLIQGRDYVFESRWAGSDSSRFPALTAELLARDPSVVVFSTILAAKAAQNLLRSVPIVMPAMNDPVAAGLVASLARPGGNITGVSAWRRTCFSKCLKSCARCCPNCGSSP